MSGSMYLEKVHSEGLAHISYILGSGGQAAVIDPRRDCEAYVHIAQRKGTQITHIFETHRNEDYLIGSRDLASRTGAAIYHGKATPFGYGHPLSEGDAFNIGRVTLTVLNTPGHTDESVSLVLSDRNFGPDPVAVFTGDALFVGDVGRTDFFPDRAEEVAGLLYESLFEKILPLGDGVILYPAHGAGSLCGGGLAEREFSTLGYEREHNPVLQKINRDEFIRYKTSEHHYKPPYFTRMEKLNGEGSSPLAATIPAPRPLDAQQFFRAHQQGMIVLDIRSPEAVSGAMVPSSVAIPLEMVPGFAGYLLPYDEPLGLVADTYEQVETAVHYLLRMGYDDVVSFLARGMNQWEKDALPYHTISSVNVNEVVRRIERDEPYLFLDVRELGEVIQGTLPKSRHIYLGELPQHMNEIPGDVPIVTFCDSGRRAMIAASVLRRNGYEKVETFLGSMAACRVAGCPIQNRDGAT